MNHREQVEEWMTGLRLPPNYDYGVSVDRDGRVVVTLMLAWPVDVFGKLAPAMTYTNFVIKPELTEDAVIEQVVRYVKNAWLHELKEWLTYKGEHVLGDPHPTKIASTLDTSNNSQQKGNN